MFSVVTSNKSSICICQSRSSALKVCALSSSIVSTVNKDLSWDYKYQRRPCASPCKPDDIKCLKLEALFQCVLGYPRLPPKVYRLLFLLGDNIDSVTSTVEQLSDLYGKELVIYFLRKCPSIMSQNFSDIMARVEHVKTMLHCHPNDVLLLLRKFPRIMCLDVEEQKTRFMALHKILPLLHEDVLKLVKKYPVVLGLRTEVVESMMDELRNLSNRRHIWTADLETISPSLLAFFIRDNRDLLSRLEFLVITGHSSTATLREVFKVSNNVFASKHQGFHAFLRMKKQHFKNGISREPIEESLPPESESKENAFRSSQQAIVARKREPRAAQVTVPDPEARVQRPRGREQPKKFGLDTY